MVVLGKKRGEHLSRAQTENENICATRQVRKAFYAKAQQYEKNMVASRKSNQDNRPREKRESGEVQESLGKGAK